MLDFPKSTIFNRKIPKRKFYDNIKMSNKIEQQFIKEIDTIYWKNKLSADTLNVELGSNVKEIEIIEINLREQRISPNILELIDKEIPYHIVFILRYQNMGQIWISYKEDSRYKETFKVATYCQTVWLDYGKLQLKIEGLDLDKIYENFIIQIAGEKITIEADEDIKAALARAKDKERLILRIERLKTKIRKEKQYNLQVKLFGELKDLEKKLDNLIGRDK